MTSIIFSPLSSEDIMNSPLISDKYPTIITTDDSPIKFPLIVTKPAIIATYPDLNKDPWVQNKMVKYIYYKTYDKWLRKDLKSALKHLKVSGGKVVPTKSKDDVDKNSKSDIEKKIEFVEENIMPKRKMAGLLHEIVATTGMKWYDITRNEEWIKQEIKRRIQKKSLKMAK